MNRARRFLCRVALLAPAALGAGCLIPYAYPKLDYVPGCDLGPKVTDVHAFRVDVTADQADIDANGSYTLSEIVPKSDGTFPPQANLSLERGHYVFGVVLNYNVGRLHATRVRLYRPGYQLVELPAWSSNKDIVWRATTDWREQEKAIEDLIRWPTFTTDGHTVGGGDLARTGIPEAARRALVFVATEYERVAALATNPEDATRLREKARRLAEPMPISPSPAPGANSRNPTQPR
jgi:hypothetical protein